MTDNRTGVIIAGELTQVLRKQNCQAVLQRDGAIRVSVPVGVLDTSVLCVTFDTNGGVVVIGTGVVCVMYSIAVVVPTVK